MHANCSLCWQVLMHTNAMLANTGQVALITDLDTGHNHSTRERDNSDEEKPS